VRLSNHLLLCSRGVSKRAAPLPVITVSKYLQGRSMRGIRHYQVLARTIAEALCGYNHMGPLWRAVYSTPPRDWSQVVMLMGVGKGDFIDWHDLILIDYSDTTSWGSTLTQLVLRELNLIALKADHPLR
jgi:hypothetical protein